MRPKLVLYQGSATLKVANGAVPPGPPLLRINFPESASQDDFDGISQIALPIFGEVVAGKDRRTFYLSRFKMPLETVTAQLTIWQEAGVLAWEYA